MEISFFFSPTKTSEKRLLLIFCFHILERAYQDTLQSVKESFPQYVRELEGVADGAQVEFHKVKGIQAVFSLDFC